MANSLRAAALTALLAAPAAATPYGILLLAHGGAPEWNRTVAGIAGGLDKQAPTETAFGMADPAAIQSAVDRLQRRGAQQIVAVPLFIHSRSEVMDQTRYVLGLREKPSEVLRDALAAMTRAMPPEHAAHMGMGHRMSFSTERAKVSVPVTLAPALDASEIVSGVLWRRALSLSREPARETVILVGHGPVDPRADEAWLATMRLHAERVRRVGGFAAAEAVTIHDDAPPDVKRAALERLRDSVRRASENGGRAIVLPYLIARGGIEDHITGALSGLSYAWDGRALCPDPAIERWAAETAETTARASRP